MVRGTQRLKLRRCLWPGLTRFSSWLSSWHCLAASTAMSICDCSLLLSSKVTATRFNKLKIRRMMLCPRNTSKWKNEWVNSWVEWLLTSAWLQIHSQPKKEREAGYVQVPLSSEQLHVHMVINIRVCFGVMQRLRPGVLVHLSYSIWGRVEVWNDAADEDKQSVINTHPVKERSKP